MGQKLWDALQEAAARYNETHTPNDARLYAKARSAYAGFYLGQLLESDPALHEIAERHTQELSKLRSQP